jgi:hypothetical protein
MLDGDDPLAARGVDVYVELHAAGDRAKGEFRCSGCGYGVAISNALPACPMCGGAGWERAPWTPFARADVAPHRWSS